MSPVFLSVEIPSSSGPAGQCNDSLIISSVCLSVCGVRVSVSVCELVHVVSVWLYFYAYILCVCAVCAQVLSVAH